MEIDGIIEFSLEHIYCFSAEELHTFYAPNFGPFTHSFERVKHHHHIQNKDKAPQRAPTQAQSARPSARKK